MADGQGPQRLQLGLPNHGPQLNTFETAHVTTESYNNVVPHIITTADILNLNLNNNSNLTVHIDSDSDHSLDSSESSWDIIVPMNTRHTIDNSTDDDSVNIEHSPSSISIPASVSNVIVDASGTVTNVIKSVNVYPCLPVENTSVTTSDIEITPTIINDPNSVPRNCMVNWISIQSSKLFKA